VPAREKDEGLIDGGQEKLEADGTGVGHDLLLE